MSLFYSFRLAIFILIAFTYCALTQFSANAQTNNSPQSLKSYSATTLNTMYVIWMECVAKSAGTLVPSKYPTSIAISKAFDNCVSTREKLLYEYTANGMTPVEAEQYVSQKENTIYWSIFRNFVKIRADNGIVR